jgi:hypothetical protein
MEEKGIPTHSTSEKPASKGSDMEREPDLEKDIESFAGVDEKMEREANKKAENDPNIVDWDGEVCLFLVLFIAF